MIRSSHRLETLLIAESAVNQFERELKKFKTSYKKHHQLIPGRQTTDSMLKRLEGRVEVMHRGKLTLLDPVKHELGKKVTEPADDQEKEVYLLAKSLSDCYVIDRTPFDQEFVTSMLLRAVKSAIERREKKGGTIEIVKTEFPLPEEVDWSSVPAIEDDGFMEAAKNHFLSSLLIGARMERMIESRIPLFQGNQYIGDIDVDVQKEMIPKAEVEFDEKELEAMAKRMIKELKLSLGHPGKVSKKQKRWKAQFKEQLEELAKLSLREAIQLRRNHHEHRPSRKE